MGTLVFYRKSYAEHIKDGSLNLNMIDEEAFLEVKVPSNRTPYGKVTFLSKDASHSYA